MTLEEFIYQTNQVGSVDQLFMTFENVMRGFGFDRILFTLMNDHPTLKKEAEHGIVKSYPDDWVDHYLERGYDVIDPVRALAFVTTGAFTWREVINTHALSKKQMQMFNEAEEARLYNGVGVALRGAGGAVAALGAASTEKNVDTTPLLLDKINLMANQFYVCFWRLMETQPPPKAITLTNREGEILKWSARGFTKSAIGERLNISQHTVDYHARGAMKKLNAKNMTSAVVMALNLGIIQI